MHWTSGFQPLWGVVSSVLFLIPWERATFAAVYLASILCWVGSALLLVLTALGRRWQHWGQVVLGGLAAAALGAPMAPVDAATARRAAMSYAQRAGIAASDVSVSTVRGEIGRASCRERV